MLERSFGIIRQNKYIIEFNDRLEPKAKKIIGNNWRQYIYELYIFLLATSLLWTNRRNFKSYEKDLVGRRLIKEAIIKSE